MPQYHWKFVFAKDFVAILAASVGALRSYTDSWDHLKTCDPAWKTFVLYLAVIAVALTVIEISRWAVWLVRGELRKGDSQPQESSGAPSLVLINSSNLKIAFLFFLAGAPLLVLSHFLGGPTPCMPLAQSFSIPFALGSIAFALGLLMIASGLIHEAPPAKH
jgi:NADH:ubiquinone oxidoreductase subunit 5 (subunit L)/multisubunit Na+/H+ antiporter MnhA subunit